MALSKGREMVLGIVMALCLSITSAEAQLRLGFYLTICPPAELIVKQEVLRAMTADRGIAASLLRLHFHDCFVRGCDGSVLIDSTPSNTAEKDAVPNKTLRGFQIIDNAKARLEEVCPGTVSCADILAFAARDSVQLSGGGGYAVPAGRRDGTVSKASDTTDLPPPFVNLPQLIPFFTKKGLSEQDMIVLSGAHTIGRAHCGSFANRLYNFSASASTDPTLDAEYAEQLKQECPPGSNNVVFMDPRSPFLFDTSYYRNIVENRGLFTSDQTLATAGNQVKQLAGDSIGFPGQFSSAIVKMGSISVLTGAEGEIRANCRVIN